MTNKDICTTLKLSKKNDDILSVSKMRFPFILKTPQKCYSLIFFVVVEYIDSVNEFLWLFDDVFVAVLKPRFILYT